MRTVVEVGDWEHECCGPAYERDMTVELTCLVVPAADGTTRYVESHHDPVPRPGATRIRGRVADIALQRPDGSVEPIERLPSGRALRGFDDDDDGHLERPWTGEPVAGGAQRYLVTVLS